MTFKEWAEAYALDDEPCMRLSRRQDCESARNAALKAEHEREMAAACAASIRKRSNVEVRRGPTTEGETK